MTEKEDVESQQGEAPKNPPGFKARPSGAIPKNKEGNRPDYVDEVVESQPDRNGQGRVRMQVIDQDGKVKDACEYTRVSGEGSIELIARDSQLEEGIKWLKTRRDRVPGQD